MYMQNVRKSVKRSDSRNSQRNWAGDHCHGVAAADRSRNAHHMISIGKKIVRERMSACSLNFSIWPRWTCLGALRAGAAGRSGLHEYPEALKELQQAIEQGFTQGEVYYALGGAGKTL